MAIRLRLLLLYSFFIFHFFSNDLHALESYELHFRGIQDPGLIQMLRNASQLVTLANNPPSTVAALRHRAEADIPRFTKIFQSLAYYDAQIDFYLQTDTSPIQVLFTIDPGEQFLFSSFDIVAMDESSSICESIELAVLEVVLERAAFPKTILRAEELLLSELEAWGYPLALIKERNVIADLSSKTVNVTLIVDSGPQAFFGETTINGSKKLCDTFFRKKIAWNRGDLFDPCKIEDTLEMLEASSLFSSINIRHAEAVDPDGTLPILIDVKEAKHRSVGFGVGYSTLRSFGIVGEYENRNERAVGERFALRAAAWNNLFDGTFFYLVPDWLRRRQDLIWLLQSHHEITEGYTESYLSASSSVERQISPHMKTSIGLMFKHLKNEKSEDNGLFNLFKIPLGIRWVNVDDPHDPTFGYMFSFKTIPTFEIFNDPFAYAINTLSIGLYAPLGISQFILAQKITLGIIAGSGRRNIPPSERFYAGSEETLRGYKYLTVSPLNRKHDPTGGKSMMIINLELRKRIRENWEGVLFYDIGNVYKEMIPLWGGKQLQSVGIGVRYHTPVGPLRLDVGFPLNKRRSVDHSFELYLSLGQAF